MTKKYCFTRSPCSALLPFYRNKTWYPYSKLSTTKPSLVWPILSLVLPALPVGLPLHSLVLPSLSFVLPGLALRLPVLSLAWPCLNLALSGLTFRFPVLCFVLASPNQIQPGLSQIPSPWLSIARFDPPQESLTLKKTPKTVTLSKIKASCGQPRLCDWLPLLPCKEVILASDPCHGWIRFCFFVRLQNL